MFALIIKANSYFIEVFCRNWAHFLEEFCGNVGFDMSSHAIKKTPRSGLLRGGGWGGCYAEAQAMRAWASASTAAQRELMLASTASLAAARSALGALWAKR